MTSPETAGPQTSNDDGYTLIEHLPFTTAKVIGARARIGLVVLASDYTIEHEFRAMIAMEGVDLFMARIANDPRVTPETLAAMEPMLTDTASVSYTHLTLPTNDQV